MGFLFLKLNKTEFDYAESEDSHVKIKNKRALNLPQLEDFRSFGMF